MDRSGGPTIDPTRNVLDLVFAGNGRQDDLRAANGQFFASEVLHVKELAALRAQYQQQLAEAEAKRIDAIRAVDVNAVAVASERQAAAANVLANQVAQSADALRTLVSTTATATAEQQRQQMTTVTDRLTALERSQYEGRGRSLMADPAMAELAAAVKELSVARAAGTGKSEGMDKTWTLIVGAVVVAAALFGPALLNRSTPAAPPVIVVPGPAAPISGPGGSVTDTRSTTVPK